MNLSKGVGMYRLYDMGNDVWQLHSSKFGAKEGPFKAIATYMVFDLGFQWTELEMAISSMCKNGHNSAEFGIFQCFIFSFNKEMKNVG